MLERPNTYIGATRTITVNDFFYESSTNSFTWKEGVPYNEGLVKLVNELIDNAVDNSLVSTNPTTKIFVEMNGGVFKISNNGESIPCIPMEGSDRLIPEVIFGEMFSGSNYGEGDRVGAGTNGIGAKACNIFSTKFKVVVRDEVVGKTFVGEWVDNMGRMITSKLMDKNPLKKGIATEVTFSPDTKYFENTTIEQMEPWILTRLVQVSHTTKNVLKVYYNGKMMPGGSFKHFIKLFPGKHAVGESEVDCLTYGVGVSTTGEFNHSSYVNNLRTTSNDSTHTKFIHTKVVSVIKDFFSKKSKGSSSNLTNGMISSKLHVFVNIHVPSPEFSSQTKVKLTSPLATKNIELKGLIGLLKKGGVLEEIEQSLVNKSMKTLGKQLNGSKKSNVVVDKYDSAKWAGTNKSHLCTLFIVEGDSAKTMVTTGMSVIGRESNGVFPIRGKLMNVRGAQMEKIGNNEEIKSIMKILGLKVGCSYETVEEFKTLRYGKICILADADLDGHHITSLLLNFILTMFPNLVIKHNFVVRFVTPIIKCIRKSHPTLFFFNSTEYSTWASNNDTSKYQIIHLKGLGTSERTDTIQYFKESSEKHMKQFLADNTTTPEYTDNIFNPKKSNWRKEWLSSPTRGGELDYSQASFKIDDFYDTEMFQFSKSDILRSIPSVVDGLKKSQRQVLFGSFYHFEKTGNKQYKVAQLAGVVAAHAKYAHGEVSLQDCIVGMAQTFSGSNNITLLENKGAFGSRLMNGKDAASPRYIYTCLTSEARKLFPKEDDPILDWRTEEGQTVEPHFYVPTVPLILINGTSGIATGYSTEIPAFNIADIVKMIRDRLNGVEPTEPLPWYKDYTANELTEDTPTKWIFRGKWHKSGPKTITITELPIGYSIDGYKANVLNKLQASGVLDSVEVCHRDENTPNFVIKFNSDVPVDPENVLKLTKSTSKSCLNLLDAEGVIKTHTSILSILDDWLKVRLEYSEKRRNHLINNAKLKLKDIEMKMKFIRHVVNGEIVLIKMSKDGIVNQMLQFQITKEYHDQFLNLPLYTLSNEKINELETQFDKTKHSLLELETISNVKMYMQDLDNLLNSQPSNKRKCEGPTSSDNKKSKHITPKDQ